MVIGSPHRGAWRDPGLLRSHSRGEGNGRGSAGSDCGRTKIVIDEDREILLGVTFAGPGVVDHLHSATIAVTAEAPLDRLWHAVPAFRSMSEIWLELLEASGL